MLLARALIVHFFGASWRLPDALPAPAAPAAEQPAPVPAAPAQPGAAPEPASDAAAAAAPPAAPAIDDAVVVPAAPAAPHSELLRWFADSDEQPFSLHSLVAVRAPHGVVAGQWLGPHALCQTLAATVEAACGGAIRVHVVTSGGGGAPTLYRELPARAAAVAEEDAPSSSRPAEPAAAEPSGARSSEEGLEPEQPTGSGDAAAANAAAAEQDEQQRPAADPGGGGDSGAPSTAPPRAGPFRFRLPEALLSPSEQAPDAASGWPPLVVLVPLVLGLGKQINPAYLPQLRATFRFPQSLGIVGGKPGSSLYFVGCQEESGSVVYLDPHEVQAAESAAAAGGGFPPQTYHCAQLRHTPMATMDPSLALAFYARTRAEYDDLCNRLEAR